MQQRLSYAPGGLQINPNSAQVMSDDIAIGCQHVLCLPAHFDGLHPCKPRILLYPGNLARQALGSAGPSTSLAASPAMLHLIWARNTHLSAYTILSWFCLPACCIGPFTTLDNQSRSGPRVCKAINHPCCLTHASIHNCMVL